jgi:ABC-type ATPase with predicted acetyltransferase domain
MRQEGGRGVNETRRAMRARAAFGLVEREPGHPALASARDVAHALGAMTRGMCALITGPSGSGKSTVLRELEALLHSRGEHVVKVESDWESDVEIRAAIDAIAGPMGRAAAWLAMAGLGDARAMVRTVAALSEGERARLALARAMCAARRRGTWVLADEFGSALDGITGCAVAASIAKWARRANLRLVCATGRDEWIESMSPDVLVWMGEPPLVLWKEDEGGKRQCNEAAIGRRAGKHRRAA